MRCVFPLALITLLTACGDNQPDGARNHDLLVDPSSTAFKKLAEERLKKIQEEERIIESAPWFGRTGLPDGDERELPRYIRREFGRLLGEPGALQARDLTYLGIFFQDGETIHYWRIDHPMGGNQYAYIVTAPTGHEVMGWSGRTPPR